MRKSIQNRIVIMTKCPDLSTAFTFVRNPNENSCEDHSLTEIFYGKCPAKDPLIERDSIMLALFQMGKWEIRKYKVKERQPPAAGM